jgi:drug/metabolite transporter (DMT)-like permease
MGRGLLEGQIIKLMPTSSNKATEDDHAEIGENTMLKPPSMHHGYESDTNLRNASKASIEISTYIAAGVYVLSGVSQPLIMTQVKHAGLADPTCQLYMFFYYLGPAMVAISFLFDPRQTQKLNGTEDEEEYLVRRSSPKPMTLMKAVAISIFDIFAQALNYTGSSFAGPTIFAIVYSSVTVWCAIYSRLIISRYMNHWQWIGVCLVFLGLTITAFSSVALGPDVFQGACFVLMGSSIHALTYVLYEIMLTQGEDQLTVRLNCSIQGVVACSAYLIWQLCYTRYHITTLITEPMQIAHTTLFGAVLILFSFAVSNLVHAFSYFHTLKYYPMGAVSAGVMKGLQAVLVFVFTSIIYCNRIGGKEMCFNQSKLISLIVVVTGVLLYTTATAVHNKEVIIGSSKKNHLYITMCSTPSSSNKKEYTSIVDTENSNN